MNVDIAVCGRFHYHKYLKLLVEKNLLNKIFFSYKIGYDFNGVNKHYLQNFPIKEYLLYLDLYFLKKFGYKYFLKMGHFIWQKQVLNYIKKNQNSLANNLHVMIHGVESDIINFYKKNNKIVIGEAVNAHPYVQIELMKKELKKYNIPFRDIEVDVKDKMHNEFLLCDVIIVPSNWVKKSFLKMGFPDQRIFVIPYGLELNVKFQRNRIIEKKITVNKKVKIVSVGQITFRKGQIYLIEAVNKLIKLGYNLELTLIGYLDPLYKKILMKKGLVNAFNYIPHIENENIVNFLSQFDLFILPSIEDGFSIAVSEALSAGLPVITTYTTGASDLIQEGINGYIIKPQSTESIINAVLKSINKTFYINLSTLPTWEDYVNNYEKLLKEL